MTKSEHLNYLVHLESKVGVDKDSLCAPRKEGAFWWGEYLTFNEYAKLYREECIEWGWIDG